MCCDSANVTGRLAKGLENHQQLQICRLRGHSVRAGKAFSDQLYRSFSHLGTTFDGRQY